MVDKAPASRSEDVSANDFPSDSPPIRMCVEPGCDNAAKKRGRGYAKWCDEHLFNHPNSGDDSPPKSRVIVQPDKGKVAKKAEDQIKSLLGIGQMAFYAKGDTYCTWAIGEVGEDIAKHGGTLASNIKWMAAAVDKSENAFAAMLLLISVGKLTAMIGVHHDWIPYAGPVKLLVPKPPPKDGVVVPIRMRNLNGDHAVEDVIDAQSHNPTSFT